MDFALGTDERDFDTCDRAAGSKPLRELQRADRPWDDRDLPTGRRIRHQQTDGFAEPLIETRNLAGVSGVDDAALSLG
ncbi:hypothetical protein [Bradyrhizobium sp. McL0616]|uniref:hypothetical protein n=1 Tax=Bradyrhizobium sp. McL0616 TaxID=3415674 RepID=UPI003CF2A06E